MESKRRPVVASIDSVARDVQRHYDFYTGVPDSELGPVINKLDGYIPAPRENHAMAMAFGNRLAGGKPIVLMQNSGLGLIGDVIYGLFHLYGLGCVCLISNRGEEVSEEPQHREWGKNTHMWLQLMGFTVFDIEEKMDILQTSCNLAYDEERLVAVIVHRGNIR